MKQATFTVLIGLSVFLMTGHSFAGEKDRYQVVIEESYYKVEPKNEDKFLEVFKKKVFPFWKEMERLGLIDGEIKMYTQRIHTLKPSWTFKTVVRFKNYNAIDKWLEKRDEVYGKLFPQEGEYKTIRDEISAITENHWDEFIREIPLSE
jgi:hypothetical protein